MIITMYNSVNNSKIISDVDILVRKIIYQCISLKNVKSELNRLYYPFMTILDDEYNGNTDDIHITANIKDSDDIFALLQIKEAIDNLLLNRPEINVHLKMPYLPYARYDRRMHLTDSFSLKVFTNILNSSFVMYPLSFIFFTYPIKAAIDVFNFKSSKSSVTFLISEFISYSCSFVNS